MNRDEYLEQKYNELKKEVEDMKQRAIKEYTVYDVIRAGYNFEPLKCIHCGYVGETTYNQGVGDAFCEICGKWQIGDE